MLNKIQTRVGLVFTFIFILNNSFAYFCKEEEEEEEGYSIVFHGAF